MFPERFWAFLLSLNWFTSLRATGSFFLTLGGSLSLSDNQNLLSMTLRRHTMRSTDLVTDFKDWPKQLFLGSSCSSMQMIFGQRVWSCFIALTIVPVSHFSFRAWGDRTQIMLWHFSDSDLSWLYPKNNNGE